MRKFFVFFILAFFSLGLIAADVEAKRMGGGKSFGKQRQSLNQQTTQNQQQTSAPAQNTTAPASGGSKWGGALAGLAAGGLLAALFMGGAFEGINMMDILMLILIVGIVFFIIRMMRRSRSGETAQSMQYSGVNSSSHGSVTPPLEQTAGSGTNTNTAPQQPNIPSGFKVEPFLRNAKISFIRLQAAHDRGDINDIREYTTPEMLAEISMQIQERGDLKQESEVMFLDANLLNVETSNDSAIASVRFTGQMRELPDGEPEAFDEVWHVEKSLKDSDSAWLLAGIQQTEDTDL